MDMFKVASMEDIAALPKTKWNVSQPEDVDARENALDSDEGLDLILMPGLAFDLVQFADTETDLKPTVR